MLKKMRWHFISAAMSAFFAVILLLLCAINLWNYHITTQQQDTTLQSLLNFENRGAPPFDSKDFQIAGPFGHFSPEMQHMTRFFTIRYDQNGTIVGINKDFVTSISNEEAIQFATAIMNSEKTSGYYNNYRYLKADTLHGSIIICLNAEREIQALKAVLFVSVITAILSLLTVFLLVVAFSKRAINPYIKNIEAQKQFITDAGHELKTPLTAISTSADVLAMEHENDEWVQNIQTQSARLAKLISNLITLSRLDEEQPHLEITHFSLSEAIWEISEPFQILALANGKDYEQQIEDGIFMQGDRNAIQQVISILLDNAIKYSDNEGNICLNVSTKHHKKIITVSNSCTLKEVEHLDRLFDRFYRPDKSRQSISGGTGLGLSIAKATVENHGGKIKVESHNQNHIVFTILL